MKKLLLLFLTILSITVLAKDLYSWPTTEEIFVKYDMNKDKIIDSNEHLKIYNDYKKEIKLCVGDERTQIIKRAYIYVAKFGHAPRTVWQKLRMLTINEKGLKSNSSQIDDLLETFTNCSRNTFIELEDKNW